MNETCVKYNWEGMDGCWGVNIAMLSYPVSEHAACMVDNFLIIHGGNINPVTHVTRTNKRHHYYQNKTLGNLIMKNLILISLQKQLVIKFV